MSTSPKKKLRSSTRARGRARTATTPVDDPPADAEPHETPPTPNDTDEQASTVTKTPNASESDDEAPVPPRLGAADLDGYRRACVQLERQRHDKVYQAEHRLLQAEASIEAQHAEDRRAAEEEYAAGVEALKARMLADNLERSRRIEERLYGLPRRPAENARILRPNGNPDGELRTTRRARASRDAAASKAVALPPHFQVALDDADIKNDLAQICGKRSRSRTRNSTSPDAITPAAPERRTKRRK